MNVREELVRELKLIVGEAGFLDGENLEKFLPKVDDPVGMRFGDFTSNVAMVLARILKKNPMEIANEIAGKLKIQNSKLDFIEKVEVVKPGFLNFWLSKSYLISEVEKLIGMKSVQLSSDLEGKKLVIEFAHPNTHKVLHIGHLRNISTGEALVRLSEALGLRVIRANYQGDVGMHIAKALYGLLDIPSNKERLDKVEGTVERVSFLGKAYADGSKLYESDEKARQKIHDYNYLVYAVGQRYQKEKGVETGSIDYLKFVKGGKRDLESVYSVWKQTRQWSLDYYEEMYAMLGASFDRYYFESECLEGKTIAEDAIKKGILEKSDGAVIFRGEQYGLNTRVFVNSLGLPTYEAKELALAKKEFSEFGDIDKVIHVAGPEQSSFFKVTFKVEELLDPDKYKDKQMHMAYGWVRLKHGKMSSRLGNVVSAEELISSAKEEVRRVMKAVDYSNEEKERIAEAVAVGAIKYSFLKVSINQDIAFDLKESINFEGNSGPYLQYTYARTRSVLRKSQITNHKSQMQNYKFEKEELDLVRMIARFEGVVREAGERLAPHILCNYLFELAQAFNLFYQKHSILNAEGKVRDFRVGLTVVVGNVIKYGLRLLGIEAPERM